MTFDQIEEIPNEIIYYNLYHDGSLSKSKDET